MRGTAGCGGGVWEAVAQDVQHPGDGSPDARMGSLGSQQAQEALLLTDRFWAPGLTGE